MKNRNNRKNGSGFLCERNVFAAVGHSFGRFAVVLLLLLTMSVFCYAAGGDFSCYVTDAQGCRIDSYYAEQNDAYYLFLTSGEDISQLAVQLPETIVSAAKGDLDNPTHILTNAFAQSGDSVELTDAQGGTVTVVVMQSSLPSLYIALDGTTLSEIHADKEIKYPGCKVNLTDPSGTYAAISASDVQIKGRGNSSWLCFDKKGYQIKFDKKTSVLGMPKAKKWVLLASSFDDSMMRTKLALDFAANFNEVLAPKTKYVDLWIAGEYLGTYLVTEKVEIGSDRVYLQDEHGGIFEHDNAFYKEEAHWFKDDFFGYFTVKETKEEDNEETVLETMELFKGKLEQLKGYVTNNAVIEEDVLESMIDLDSVAAYYLINEYLLSREVTATSFYWYMDGPDDVLHVGPVWDYDTCMGNDMENRGYDSYYLYRYPFFSGLLNTDWFMQRLETLMSKYGSEFAALDESVDALSGIIGDSASMNYVRWDMLGKHLFKGTYADTYAEAVANLKYWLGQREATFDLWDILDIYTTFDPQTNMLTISFKPKENYTKVWFPTWSEENGQDDLVWYEAAKQANGTWTCTVDLSKHGSVGNYNIHIYGDKGSGRTCLRSTTKYIDRLAAPAVTAQVSGSTMQITLKNAGNYTRVWFPTWSEENGQDDLVWYKAVKQPNGTWTCTVNLAAHRSVGKYLIHVYGDTMTPDGFISGITATVAQMPPSVTAQVSGSTMQITLKNAGNYTKVWFPTWSAENGQDDLVWYEAVKQPNGTWTCRVNLAAHRSVGKYLIHVYGDTMTPDGFISGITATVAQMPPSVTAEVSGSTMTVTLNNAGNYTKVWFPTWSEENGQDDLKWYEATKQPNGTWTCRVNLAEHRSTGKYVIHVYGDKMTSEGFVTHTTAVVK